MMKFDCVSKDEIETLILSAAHQGDIHSLEIYLSSVTNPNIYLNHVYNELYGQKCSVLMIACLNEYENMIHMLVNTFKPDLEVLNVVRITDRDQQLETFENVTVLWVAAALNNFEIVKILVEHKAQVNHRIKTSSTPLRCACCNDNIEMVRYLVQNGADIHITKIKHFTNLVASVFNGHLQMVAYLVDELGCDVNECLDDGRSPLIAAVYHGSIDLVKFLLDHGARNFVADYNHMSPLMLAAEKRRIDLVNIISHNCLLIEQIEAEELLGSAFICLELGNSDLEQAFAHMYRALELRSIHQLPKKLKESTHEVFNHRQECQTVDQLKELRSNPDNMYIEALLIRERLLGLTNTKYYHSLRFYGVHLADNMQYNRGIALWMYELKLHQEYSIDIDKEELRQFVSLFSSMMSASSPILIDSLHTVMTVVVGELKRNTTDFDYHLHTLLFLITIASQILLEKNMSDSEHRMLYYLIHIINRYQFVSQTFGASLLHLSLDGWTTAYDYNFDLRYKYPCLRTVRILLQCGADVNANNLEQLTPLHVFVSTSAFCNETILQLLCDAHAHLDYASESGETPIDMAFNPNIRQLLKTRMTLSLKCLCARLIRKERIPFHGMFSNSLVTFVQRH